MPQKGRLKLAKLTRITCLPFIAFLALTSKSSFVELWLGAMPNRRACDRCYRHKEKCHFEDDAEGCKRCVRIALTCTTLRSHPRQGRRPKVNAIGSHGSLQIWDTKAIQSTSTGTGASRRSLKSQVLVLPSPLSASETGHGQIQASSTVDLVIRGNEGLIQVARAAEPTPASQICVSNKFPAYDLPTPSPYTYQVTDEIPAFDPDSPSTLKRFYASYNFFMFGPTFAPNFRVVIKQSYMCSPLLLHDILRAMSQTVTRVRQKTGLSDQVDIIKGSNSLQKLRTAQVAGIQDAFAIIALGQTLAAFDLLTCCIGPRFILRYSLSSIEPWYGELSRNPSLDPITITPILWDTVSCLVRREVPVLKPLSTDHCAVDRMAGLCTTLLPILYDLCVASNTLQYYQHSDPQPDTDPLDSIEQRLALWTPKPPRDFTSTFSNQEILRMKAQASMYRTAALLVCHRIRNPIGMLDGVASSYAYSIMLDFSKYSALIGPDIVLQNVAFPILMATLEISDVRKDIWNSIALSAVAPACAAKISAFVEYVWMERFAGSTSYMFDLVDSGPDFMVIP